MIDNLRATFTLAKWLTVAAAVFIAGHARADGCEHQVYPTSVCIDWAPITGDPVADKCTIAKLNAKRLEYEFDPTRPRTVADDPLPPRTVMLERLRSAQSQIDDECK